MSRQDGSGNTGATGSRSGGSSPSRTDESLQTPWTRARKLRYEIQEQRLNDLPGGQKGINSGRLRPFKRDGRIYDFLIEARINQKPGAKTATISKQEFQELRRQALVQPGGMKPGMQITIDDLDLMVIDLRDFTDMYNLLVELSAREDR
jgi:hypothetical protein